MLRNIHKNLLLSIMMLMTVSMFAQPEKFNRASLLMREKNTDQALLTIDSVIVHPETKDDPASWTLRAYIYFDVYKRTDKQKLYSPLRDTIITSLKRSIVLNAAKPDEDNAGNNSKLLINLSATYFNLAKSLLEDSINNEKSLYAYNKFKELYHIADSTANFSAKDIEYYLAVGSVYSQIFIKDNKDLKAQNIAKSALLKVLDIQPDNALANVNLGLMYYNQAVNLTKNDLDWGDNFDKLDFVQESIVKLAKQSEQFISKVYNNDNKNLKAIEALYYIYRMLNENAKSDEYKKIGETFGIKFNTEEKVGDSIKPAEDSKDDKATDPKKEEGKPAEQTKEEKKEVKEEAKEEKKEAKEAKKEENKPAEETKEAKKAAKEAKEKEENDAKAAKEAKEKEEKEAKKAEKEAKKKAEEDAKQAEKEKKDSKPADDKSNDVNPK